MDLREKFWTDEQIKQVYKAIGKIVTPLGKRVEQKISEFCDDKTTILSTWMR